MPDKPQPDFEVTFTMANGTRIESFATVADIGRGHITPKSHEREAVREALMLNLALGLETPRIWSIPDKSGRTWLFPPSALLSVEIIDPVAPQDRKRAGFQMPSTS